MNTHLYSILASVLLATGCHHAAAPAPPEPDPGEQRAQAVAHKLIGKPLPALTLSTLDGQTIDLASLDGSKPIYLKFWATWCQPCRDQMPSFERLYEKYGDKVAVIAVDAGLDDDAATVRAFRDSHGMKMPIVVDDGRLAAALDLEVTPQHVLVGRDGRVAFVGHLDGSDLDAALERVVASEPREVARATPTVHPVIHPGESASSLFPAGQRRALVMFATWCESYLRAHAPASSQTCKRVREQIDQLRRERKDIAFEGIASGVWTSPDDIAPYRDETKTDLPITLDADGALFRAFDVHAFGTVVLIGADGNIARIVAPSEDLRAAVASL